MIIYYSSLYKFMDHYFFSFSSSSTLFRILGLCDIAGDRLGRANDEGEATEDNKGDGVLPTLAPAAAANCSDFCLAMSITGRVTGVLGVLSSSRNLMKALAIFSSN